MERGFDYCLVFRGFFLVFLVSTRRFFFWKQLGFEEELKRQLCHGCGNIH